MQAKNAITKKRIWELDFIRGLAVIGMVVIHLYYVLTQIHNINVLGALPSVKKVLELVMDYGGILFILISGICSCFSKDNLRRGLHLFLFAMLVSYITMLYQTYIDPRHSYLILFGILHCLSVCMLLGHFVLRLPERSNLTDGVLSILAIIIIAGGSLLRAGEISFPVLYGYAIPSVFPSSDYFPLLPFFGWFLLGIVIGKRYYRRGHMLFSSEKVGRFFLIRGISFIGRHSLIIYLAHQPIIFGIIAILQQIGLLS